MLVQTTHISLLERLGKTSDELAWGEFCRRYGDLIRNFARVQSLQPSDCDDVLQDVLVALAKAMPGFTYDPAKGKFRSYLKTVALHVIFARSRQKRGEVALEDIGTAVEQDSAASSIDALWDAQWRQYHLRQAMITIEAEFSAGDLAAFQRYAIAGKPVREVAEELQMSADQVYQAKSRILRRLSQVIAAQVEEEG